MFDPERASRIVQKQNWMGSVQALNTHDLLPITITVYYYAFMKTHVCRNILFLICARL